MDRLNKTLAISLATLTLAGSAPQIFAARTSHGASKQTGTSSSKKTDYTKPVKENETQIDEVEKIIEAKKIADETLRKIKEYESSHKRETLDEIYRLVSEDFIFLFDASLEEQRKTDSIINFVKKALKSDIDELRRVLESISMRKKTSHYELLASKKDYFIKTYKLFNSFVGCYSPAGFNSSQEYLCLNRIVKYLEEKESIEQKNLAQQEQERMEQERLKRESLEKTINKILESIKNVNYASSDCNLETLYNSILCQKDFSFIRNERSIGIKTYCPKESLNASTVEKIQEIEDFLSRRIIDDMATIEKLFKNRKSIKLNEVTPPIKSLFTRINKLYNANSVFEGYILDLLRYPNHNNCVGKFQKTIEYLNQKKAR